MECDLGDIKISYRVEGTGEPFLMLHGSVGDHDPWTIVLESVFAHREGWKRIYPDLPGHGHTSAPTWLKNDDQQIDIFLRFMDQIAPGERFTVGGFSLGGYLAQGILYRRFSQVDGLLCIAPAMHRRTEQIPERTILLKDDALFADVEELLKPVGQGLIVVQNVQTINRLRSTFAGYLQGAALDDPSLGERWEARLSFDPDNLPEPFDKPTLFLLGRQDNYVGYREHWTVIENFPRATFVVLDEAGHGVASIETYELCQSLINDWLDRVERGTG